MSESACEKLVASLSNYLDGEVDEKLCCELEAHMKECKNCRIVVDTTRKTIELIHDHSQEDKTPGEVRSRLYKRLHLDDFLLQKRND